MTAGGAAATCLIRGLELLAADGIDLDTELLGIGEEGGIFHRRQETRAQRREAIGRDVRRPEERASVNLLGHQEFEHLLVSSLFTHFQIIGTPIFSSAG